MPKNALIGYTGFVGQHLTKMELLTHYFNSKNYLELLQVPEWDMVICAGIYAEKWKANLDPVADWQSIEKLLNVLLQIKAKRFVLISTIDVYNKNQLGLETDIPEPTDAYGTNRYRLESCLKEKFEQLHIVRLPGLFGKGLKKNVIFDLLHHNQIEKISLNTQFQWYNLEWLADDLARILIEDIHVANLVTPPLATEAIIKRYFSQQLTAVNESGAPVRYNFKSNYNWHTQAETEKALGDFIHVEQT